MGEGGFMSHELIEITRGDIAVARDPNTVLNEAKKAAQALMTVVSQKKNPVMMGGEQYLEFEDWQTVARFYGITAMVTRTEFLDYGGVKGFEAYADAVRSDGVSISSANAMCLNDEEKWSTRTKYEWVKGKKEKVGEVAVPLFQLRSMAQTRACAKVLRNVLAWVVVLAGFRPNVAEEMTGDEEPYNDTTGGKPEVKQPQSKSLTEAQTKYFPRIEAALVTLFGEDHAARDSKLVELTTWTKNKGKDNEEIVKGTPDFHVIKTDKTLEILCHRLEKMIPKDEGLPEICSECHEPLIDGACRSTPCPEGRPSE